MVVIFLIEVFLKPATVIINRKALRILCALIEPYGFSASTLPSISGNGQCACYCGVIDPADL